MDFLRVLRLFGFNFLMVSAIGASLTKETVPVVYSGILHNNKTHQDIRMRMVFLHQPKLGQTVPVTTVLGMLYFGDEGTHEYVSLYYDTLFVHQANREIMMFRDDDARSRRLPTITMKFSSDEKMATGEMVSQTEGMVGDFTLKNGWEFGEGNYISEAGGIYDASHCIRTDGSSLRFEEIELIPSRLLQEKIVPEGIFGQTNYIGNGLCRRLGHVNCVNFSSGSYNFIQGRLDLHQGSYDWVCHRTEPESISCSSPIMKTCGLKRKQKTLGGTFKPIKPLEVGTFQWQNPIKTHGPKNCNRWEGDFRGGIIHRLGNRKQKVEIRLNAFAVGSREEFQKCVLTGSAKLYFEGAHGAAPSHINFPIVNTEINAGNESMVLHTDPYSDLAIHISIDSEGNMNGSWYSRLFGYVGELTAKKDPLLPEPISPEESVYSFEGLFTQTEKPQFQILLRAIEAGFDKSSYDPLVQLKIQGTLFYGGGLPKSEGVIPWDTFSLASYDYFTDFFAMRGNALYSGFVAKEGLYLRASNNRYLTIVKHELNQLFFYQREKNDESNLIGE